MIKGGYEMTKFTMFLMLIFSIMFGACFQGEAEAASKVVPEKITNLPVTYLFQPQSQTEIALTSAKAVWIGWKAEFDSDKYKMKNYAIKTKDQFGGGSVSTNFGSIKAVSRNGSVSVIMKNVEDFPMEVKIYIKEQG